MKKDDCKILITGGTGFIGKHLIGGLRDSHYKLRCTFRSRRPPNRSPGIEWIKVEDFADQTFWYKTLRDVRYVIHLAALAHQIGNDTLGIEDYRNANTLPMRLIARASLENGVRRVIFISSVAAIGAPHLGDTISDATPPNPDTPYGISKREAEAELASILTNSPSTDWVALRPSLVYGPGNPGNMDRIARLVARRIPLPFGNIKNRRSFLYVENLTSAILTSLEEHSLSRKTYLLSDDESVSTLDLARLISKAKGSRLKSFPIPNILLNAAAKGGDLIKSVTGRGIGIDSYSLDKLKASLRIDNSRFKNDANWCPPYTLIEGIQRTFSTPTK